MRKFTLSFSILTLAIVTLASFRFQQDQPTFLPTDKDFVVGATMTRYNITFGGGDCQTEVGDGKKTLDSIYLMMKSRPYLKIEIGVHAGEPWKKTKKCNPTQNGADAIRAYLVKKTIAKNLLSTVGYGTTEPLNTEVDENEMPTAKAKKINQRVVFKIIYSKY